MSIDGTAAARTLAGWGTTIYGKGMCLKHVWEAYKTQGARAAGSYATALDAWNASSGRHTDAYADIPAGVPVWFGAKSSSSAGDVVISLGGGRCVATDYPSYGVIRECTLAQRQAQIGRPYLGWTDNILGNPITLPASPATPSTPTTKEAPGMLTVIHETNGTVAIYAPGWHEVTSDTEYKAWRDVQNLQASLYPNIVPKAPSLRKATKAGDGGIIGVSDATWNALKKVYS